MGGGRCQFKAAGLVRHVGVSNFSLEQMERCQAIGPLESCQTPYSLAAPAAAREILPYCATRRTGVIVYSPQASGLLTGSVTRQTVAAFAPGDDRREDPTFQEPALTRSLEIHARLRELGDARGLAPGALAIAWTLVHPAVTAAMWASMIRPTSPTRCVRPQSSRRSARPSKTARCSTPSECLLSHSFPWRPPA